MAKFEIENAYHIRRNKYSQVTHIFYTHYPQSLCNRRRSSTHWNTAYSHVQDEIDLRKVSCTMCRKRYKKIKTED